MLERPFGEWILVMKVGARRPLRQQLQFLSRRTMKVTWAQEQTWKKKKSVSNPKTWFFGIFLWACFDFPSLKNIDLFLWCLWLLLCRSLCVFVQSARTNGFSPTWGWDEGRIANSFPMTLTHWFRKRFSFMHLWSICFSWFFFKLGFWSHSNALCQLCNAFHVSGRRIHTMLSS